MFPTGSRSLHPDVIISPCPPPYVAYFTMYIHTQAICTTCVYLQRHRYSTPASAILPQNHREPYIPARGRTEISLNCQSSYIVRTPQQRVKKGTAIPNVCSNKVTHQSAARPHRSNVSDDLTRGSPVELSPKLKFSSRGIQPPALWPYRVRRRPLV